LTTYTHHLELQVITVLSLISTLYKSPQHSRSLFPVCCVFISCSLPIASNNGDSSALHAQVLFSQLPTPRLVAISHQPPRSYLYRLTFNGALNNSSIAPFLLSLPCRAHLNWLPQVSSFSFRLFGVDQTDNSPFPRCKRNYCCGNVFTELLPRNGSDITAHLTIVA
jgi:hypothetical protein